MSCNYYMNNGYSCGGCARLVKTTEIEYEEDILILTIPAMKLKNHDKICLCIVQPLPEESITIDTKVVVYVGDSTVKFTPVTKWGNFVYADALKSRKLYPFYVATDSEAFVLQDVCKLGKTGHGFPIIPAAVTPA